MKSKIIILLGAVLCMMACADSNAVRSAKGAYRYKTTGKVTLQIGQMLSDTLVANLDNESGSLEVVSLHDGDSLLLTLDQLNGNVIVTRGKMNGSRLNFNPYSRTLDVPLDVTYYDTISLILTDTVIARERHEYETFDITVRGHADLYDNNLVFSLEYDGKSQTTDRTLRGKGIRCLAKKN